MLIYKGSANVGMLVKLESDCLGAFAGQLQSQSVGEEERDLDIYTYISCEFW